MFYISFNHNYRLNGIKVNSKIDFFVYPCQCGSNSSTEMDLIVSDIYQVKML